MADTARSKKILLSNLGKQGWTVNGDEGTCGVLSATFGVETATLYVQDGEERVEVGSIQYGRTQMADLKKLAGKVGCKFGRGMDPPQVAAGVPKKAEEKKPAPAKKPAAAQKKRASKPKAKTPKDMTPEELLRDGLNKAGWRMRKDDPYMHFNDYIVAIDGNEWSLSKEGEVLGSGEISPATLTDILDAVK